MVQMQSLTKDQIRHEVINLQKTLNLLERSYKEEDWMRCTSKDRNNKWLRSQSILTGIGHCRGVLQNLTPADYDFGLGDRRSMSGQQFHENAKAILDRLEHELVEINDDLKPRARRPNPILPKIPRPVVSSEKYSSGEDQKSGHALDETLLPVDEVEMKGQINIPPPEVFVDAESQSAIDDESIPPASDTNRLGNPAITLIPPSIPSSSALFGEDETAGMASPVRASLKTSTALHEDLSKQLAQMATQLRRNAERFSESLAKDEGVIGATQEKIERNYDEVSKERVRLRDHSVKSRSTTCFTIMAILVVIIAFFMTYLVIRIT